MLIFLVLMAEAFMGYLLPWGRCRSGAQVIISLFGAIPLSVTILPCGSGDYVISGATLNRFFALHVIALPLVLVMLVAMHILALHEVGPTTPMASTSRSTRTRTAGHWMRSRSTPISP